VMNTGLVSPSLSPSMDIQIASNVERYVYELCNKDGKRVSQIMQSVAKGEDVELPAAALTAIQKEFLAVSISDDATKETMKSIWEQHGILLDPHTAVGVAAANRLRKQLKGKIISLACAHPAKFPDTVRQATGQSPALPQHLADLCARREHFTVIPNDYDAFVNFITTHSFNHTKT
jgi:threonine synthase